MSSPNIGNATDGWIYAADNGCFNDNWDAGRWQSWLRTKRGALFAVVPDVVADARATRQRWDEWLPTVTDAGHIPAYVIQDGQDGVDVPWDEAGALFVGGSTQFKLSTTAERLVAEARDRGLWAHMGRVNSFKRLATAARWGCQSADGTFLAFGPDVNTPRLLNWLYRLENHPEMNFA